MCLTMLCWQQREIHRLLKKMVQGVGFCLLVSGPWALKSSECQPLSCGSLKISEGIFSQVFPRATELETTLLI